MQVLNGNNVPELLNKKKEFWKKIILLCACIIVVSLIIGLSVGLSKSETNSSSILVGTTNANVTINKLGIISSQQIRLVGGCSNLDNLDATTFEDKVYFYTRYFFLNI
jgi:hypothetical protein